MEMVMNGGGKPKYKVATYPPHKKVGRKKMEKNLKLDEELSHEKKIKKCENNIGELNLAAAEIAAKLEETKFEKYEAESCLKHLYWKCEMEHKKRQIQTTLRNLDEHHHAEIQHKLLIFEENKLFHKLKHGRNSLAEEMKIQRATKCFADERNHEKMSLTATEVKMRFPWFLKEKVESKKSIPNIKQVLYDEFLKIGKQKIAYKRQKRHFRKKIEAVEKKINALRSKLEDLNSKQSKVHAYLLQLKNATTS